jgi:flagellar basal-body rod protein FlgF
MRSQLYVSISAQLSLQKRLDTVANNIANLSTAGYRASEVSFEQILSHTGKHPVSFVSPGQDHISTQAGELTRTGNAFDIAVRGQSWLSVQRGETIVYTRDGRLSMSATGILTSVSGDPVLDAGGSPIQLDPGAGPPEIEPNGTVSQGGARRGTIGIFAMSPGATLMRGEGSSVIPDITPVLELDFNLNGIAQGFIEKSNVNPIHELTRLIAIQRTFEAISSEIQDSETAMQEAAKALSG